MSCFTFPCHYHDHRAFWIRRRLHHHHNQRKTKGRGPREWQRLSPLHLLHSYHNIMEKYNTNAWILLFTFPLFFRPSTIIIICSPRTSQDLIVIVMCKKASACLLCRFFGVEEEVSVEKCSYSHSWISTSFFVYLSNTRRWRRQDEGTPTSTHNGSPSLVTIIAKALSLFLETLRVNIRLFFHLMLMMILWIEYVTSELLVFFFVTVIMI